MEKDKFYTNTFCSRRLKALADPTRWSVVQQLIDGSKNVSELNSVLKIDVSLLSHHLKILRDEGFVECLREGKSIRYQLAAAVQTPTGRGINLGCCRLELN